MIDYSSLMRRNTYVWQDKVPSKELIDKLLKDLIKYTPSKQNLFRYTLVVADNHTNLENKLLRYIGTITPSNGRYNPQVLAPWLFTYYPREIKETRSTKEMDKDWNEGYANRESQALDVGLSCQTLVTLATLHGLQTGFCRCFHGTQKKIWKLDSKMPMVTVGVGYASDEKEYRCPVLDELKPLPEEWNPKPMEQEFIKRV